MLFALILIYQGYWIVLIHDTSIQPFFFLGNKWYLYLGTSSTRQAQDIHCNTYSSYQWWWCGYVDSQNTRCRSGGKMCCRRTRWWWWWAWRVATLTARACMVAKRCVVGQKTVVEWCVVIVQGGDGHGEWLCWQPGHAWCVVGQNTVERCVFVIKGGDGDGRWQPGHAWWQKDVSSSYYKVVIRNYKMFSKVN